MPLSGEYEYESSRRFPTWNELNDHYTKALEIINQQRERIEQLERVLKRLRVWANQPATGPIFPPSRDWVLAQLKEAGF